MVIAKKQKVKRITSRQIVQQIVNIILSKKGQRPVGFEITTPTYLYKYVVVCSAETMVQVRTIFDAVRHFAKENNIGVHHFEKDENHTWVLIDFYDIVLHIFCEEAREYYQIERLFCDEKKLRLQKSRR